MQDARRGYAETCLAATQGPVVAATDYMKTVAEQIRPFTAGRRYVTLGTDGFGRSDTRQALRAFFEVDRYHIALAALKALADDGVVPRELAADAIQRYGIDPEAVSAACPDGRPQARRASSAQTPAADSSAPPPRLKPRCAATSRQRALAGEQRVGGGVQAGARHEGGRQDPHLAHRVAGRVDELRQEGDEEDDALGIQRRHQIGVGKELPARSRLARLGQRGRRHAGAQQRSPGTAGTARPRS